MMTSPHVTIIGAGIVGMTAAYFLARTGVSVRLIDRHETPGQGVTDRSFGWINYITRDPAKDPAAHHYCHAAFDRYHALNRDFDGRLFSPATGSLLWTEDARQTLDLVHRHQQHGAAPRALNRAEFAKLAPFVVNPPECTAYCAHDFALHPRKVMALYHQALKKLGTEMMFGHSVEGIVVRNNRAAALVIDGTELATDRVIVASATGSIPLLAPFGDQHGIISSPAILITIEAEIPGFHGILCGPELEIRQLEKNRFIIAENMPKNPTQTALQDLADQTLASVCRLFHNVTSARILSVQIGERPDSTDGLARVGRVKNIDNLFLAVAHPGFILAPVIAQSLTDQIFERESLYEIPTRSIEI
ncbi:hypothetical protein TH25_08395 [Thalassospira profundimaris]|uniref:FAD dependent oxidoreductase domain-containing protein n=1 Tax=Thalassospira profundimaris TaxID=502049 RepID=A0A367XG89_9PROT|nr:FAD-binding oxidoreductase [Thalassospira profundimaris]RCK51692.1 hypothetical protein TH25_08395 [Thalassospira profundimaris]